jgi:hypothetical protein
MPRLPRPPRLLLVERANDLTIFQAMPSLAKPAKSRDSHLMNHNKEQMPIFAPTLFLLLKDVLLSIIFGFYLPRRRKKEFPFGITGDGSS